MELEKQVTSLELSKRLKELGVKQESLFYWREKYRTSVHREEDGTWTRKGIFGDEYELSYYPKPRYTTADFKWNDADLRRLNKTEISAFTIAELGEIMKSKGMGVTAYSGLVDSQKGWWVRGGEWVVEKQQYSHLIHAEEKWADALAKMLIHLIENKLI